MLTARRSPGGGAPGARWGLSSAAAAPPLGSEPGEGAWQTGRGTGCPQPGTCQPKPPRQQHDGTAEPMPTGRTRPRSPAQSSETFTATSRGTTRASCCCQGHPLLRDNNTAWTVQLEKWNILLSFMSTPRVILETDSAQHRSRHRPTSKPSLLLRLTRLSLQHTKGGLCCPTSSPGCRTNHQATAPPRGSRALLAVVPRAELTSEDVPVHPQLAFQFQRLEADG